MKSIGFTGTQEGMSADQKFELRRLLNQFKANGAIEFRHGDCIGADSEAHDIAWELGFDIIIHPCNIEEKRARKQSNHIWPEYPPLERNKIIVHSCDILIAAPNGKEMLRSGTWATIRYARKIGKSIILIEREAK